MGSGLRGILLAQALCKDIEKIRVPSVMAVSAASSALYRSVWRWHFYAALFVLPMMVLLSISGALFLFKPQIERWEERAFQGLPTAGAVTASAQVTASTASIPGAQLAYYRLPEREGDAAMVHLRLLDGSMQDVFVSPQGQVLGHIDPETRIIAVDRKIHGQLLLGRKGSWLVELAGSWAIVMIVTGLYLWWPKDHRGGRGVAGFIGAGVIWPRLSLGRRAFWRDLHAVTGFWVSSLALVLLFTGLPWADAWGSGFKAVREEMGWVKGPQDWTIGGRTVDGGDAPHAEHDHAAMASSMHAMAGMPDMAGMDHHPHQDAAMIDTMVAHARAEHLAFPAMVTPPGDAAKSWVVKSDAQNRPLRMTLKYDAQTGALISREDFATRHPIDKVIAYGVAWHEGQLFGLANQLVGLATALMLLTLVVSGVAMWWRRKPEGMLGAPPRASRDGRITGIGGWAVLGFLLIWLPMFTGSLVMVLFLDRLFLPHFRETQKWLGLARR